MPEGDSLHRAARRLQPLVGERVEVETPHPRAAATGIAERLASPPGRVGRRLLGVEAVGKNLLLSFEGGLVLRSHLRMSGRWRVERRGSPRRGRPWLVLRGAEQEAVLWRGRAHQGRAVGEALLDQSLVAGIGNMWKAESLWRARISPWQPLGALGDEELREILEHAARLMVASVVTGRESRRIYGRTGRPCPRCGTPIRSRGQGDENRTAYWCPECQT